MPKAKAQAKVRMQRRTRNTRGGISSRSNPTFGAVSTISTAPVAIGNSMRGATPTVVRTSNDSVRLIGRDFAQTAYNSGTATNWLPVAGFPLTPNCFVSSVLRNYCQMYNKFKFNKLRLHYITSSPTSSSGDVLFQVNANRTDPLPNWTGANFLPYALSKPETVIGPQWTNHTMEITPKGPARTLDLGQNIDTDYQAQGEVFLYSKTSSTDSPGYLMIDYDVSFFEQSINPKQGLLPNPLLLLQPIQLVWTTLALTANTTQPIPIIGTRGPGGTAISAITSASAFRAGDIYKFVVDLTNTNMSAYTVSAGSLPTAATLLDEQVNNVNTAITLTDGYTIYITIYSATSMTFHPTFAQAITGSQRLISGVTATPNTYAETSSVPSAGVWLMGYTSYVGSINPASLQQQ
jgi:hypothetical protein